MTDLLAAPTVASVFLRREAIEAGYTDRDIAKLVAAGDWHRLRHGAYVAGDTFRSATPEQQHALLARAVVRQARTDVVLSHLSAVPEYGGPLWGVPMDVVHVTRRDERAGRKEAGVRQHQGVLLPGDVVERGGLEVTSPARTALDVTTVVGVEQALIVVNHLLHHGLTTLDELNDRYSSMARHPFTLRTDLVLRLADSRIESVGESRTSYAMWRHHVPKPEPQLVITDRRGRAIARLDFAWPERKRWLEFDGKQKYVKYLREGETVTDAVLREKRREEMISELTSWRCMRITWADLADPVRLAARIHAFLGC
jgi:hypothetical protein